MSEETLGAVAALAAGGGLREISLVVAITMLLTISIAAVVAMRLLPLARIRPGFTKARLKKLLGFGSVVTLTESWYYCVTDSS